MSATKKTTLAVMDYNDGNVYLYTIEVPTEATDLEEFVMDFIEKNDHRFKDCFFMTGENLEVIYK